MSDKENVIDADVVNPDSAKPETKVEPEMEKQPSRDKHGSHKALWLGLVLVLALSAGGIFYLYQKFNDLEAELSRASLVPAGSQSAPNNAGIEKFEQKLATLENQAKENIREVEKFAATQKILASIPETVNAETRKLAGLEASFKNMQQQLVKMQEKAKAARENPAMAKAKPIIEDAIRAAAIFNKPQQAALLFQDAAKILSDGGDPKNSITEQKLINLSKDLSSVYVPDYVAINSGLDNLLAKIKDLPFSGDQKPKAKQATAKEPAAEYSIKQLAQGLWSDVRSLVKITHDSNDYTTVISSESKQVFSASLQLKIELARQMANAENQAGFAKALDDAAKLINSVYDVKSDRVKDFLTELEKLSATKVALADISDKIKQAEALLK